MLNNKNVSDIDGLVGVSLLFEVLLLLHSLIVLSTDTVVYIRNYQTSYMFILFAS